MMKVRGMGDCGCSCGGSHGRGGRGDGGHCHDIGGDRGYGRGYRGSYDSSRERGCGVAVAMFDAVALIMAVRMNATIVGDRDYVCACGSGSGHGQSDRCGRSGLHWGHW